MDSLDEVGLPELERRDVDRNPQEGQPPLLPNARLPAGLANDPVADFQNQAALLGDRNEFSGQYQTAAWMMPPDQCFDAAHLAGRDVDLRLVVQLELTFRQRAAKFRLDFQALAGKAHHAGVEESERLAAASLGEINLLIGERHNIFLSRAVVRLSRESVTPTDSKL